jgi:hypothetical protein
LTEKNEVHSACRRAFHLPPAMLWMRVDNPLGRGWPDVTYCLLGVAGMVEEKLLPRRGAPKHLTVDQVMWGEAWTAAGGLWHLLCRRGATWLLYDAHGARQLLDGEDAPLVESKTFPRREFLDHLAPKERRVVF